MKNQVLLFALIVVILFSCSINDQKLPLPKACFEYSSDEGFKTCTKISFTNCSTNAQEYEWDFDDGNISKDKDMVHEFDSSGTFNITLIAKNESGIDSLTKELYIDNYTDKYMHYNNIIYKLTKGKIVEYKTGEKPTWFKIVLANSTVILSEDGNATGLGEYVLVNGSGKFEVGNFDFYSTGMAIVDANEQIEMDGVPNGKIYVLKAENPVEVRIISNGVVAYYNGEVDFYNVIN